LQFRMWKVSRLFLPRAQSQSCELPPRVFLETPLHTDPTCWSFVVTTYAGKTTHNTTQTRTTRSRYAISSTKTRHQLAIMDFNIMPVDFLLRESDSEQAIANLPLPQEVSHDNPSLGLLDRLPREIRRCHLGPVPSREELRHFSLPQEQSRHSQLQCERSPSPTAFGLQAMQN
jgi:hypothetical protein